MKFVYAPEGAEPKSWEFAPGQMSSKDAIDVERLSGMRFTAWSDEVTGGSILATKALLFVLMRRDIPSLSWDGLEFKAGDCSFVWDDDEQRRIVEGLERRGEAGPLTDAEATMLRVLRAALPAKPEPGPEAASEGDASDPMQPLPEPEQPKKRKRDPSGSD